LAEAYQIVTAYRRFSLPPLGTAEKTAIAITAKIRAEKGIRHKI